MTDLAKRFPIGQNLASMADNRFIANAQQQGWRLPCTVVDADNTKGFVTIKFDVSNYQETMNMPNVTLPIIGWKYIRFPIQKGDKGITCISDVSLLNITEKVSAAPALKNSGNLSEVLAFQPIMSSKNFPSDNPNALVEYGPEGVILYDYDPSKPESENRNSVITVSPTAITVLRKDGTGITISGGNVEITGTLIINGKQYLNHEHGGVSTGTSYSTGVHNP